MTEYRRDFENAEDAYIYESLCYFKFKEAWERDVPEEVKEDTWAKFTQAVDITAISPEWHWAEFEAYVADNGYADGSMCPSFVEYTTEILPLQMLAAELEDYMHLASEYAVEGEKKLPWIVLGDRKATEDNLFKVLVSGDTKPLTDFLRQDALDLKEIMSVDSKGIGTPLQEEMYVTCTNLLDALQQSDLEKAKGKPKEQAER